jgi:glutathione S-transferase
VKIWGRANSNNVKKVLWCAEELQLPYERLDAGGEFGMLDTDAFEAVNPNRRVPVLEDEGLVLWESNAIVRYLAAHPSIGEGDSSNRQRRF